MGVSPLVVMVVWSIRSLGRQRKSLNWFVQSTIGPLHTFWTEWPSRYKWDSTSGEIVGAPLRSQLIIWPVSMVVR